MEPLSEHGTLLHVVYHVFLPPKLPQAALSEDKQSHVDLRLVHLVLEAVEQYRKLTLSNVLGWNYMYRMLSHLAEDVWTPLAQDKLARNMTNMRSGDVLALYIREQNAAVIIRKNSANTIFEIFEVQAPNAAVMSIPGKLVREFPGPAVQIPDSVFYDKGFIKETSNFLTQMTVDVLEGSSAKTTKAGSTVSEVRDSADPHYISQLFVAILRGSGKEFEPKRTLKRIADEVLWNDAYLPWRRSPLWLIIRVALQTSLSSTNEYKQFMVFFHAQLLDLCHDDPGFPHDLLFIMRAKLARRLLKIQASASEFLVRTVGDVTARIEETLQSRWTQIQNQVREVSPLHVDFEAAAIQSIPHTRQYLEKILQTRPTPAQAPPFVPERSSRLLGQSDFSVFHDGGLSNAFAADKHVALFDFESTVFKTLSGWIDNNLHSKFACTVINSCLEQYTSAALLFYVQDTADCSIMILAVMALWVALDKLATAQHPLLSDYSPEIPESMIDVLLLRSSQHLEEARNIQLYLRRRHDERKTRCSVFAERNTSDSFAVRYLDQSPNLRTLKAKIEEDAQSKRDKKLLELNSLNRYGLRMPTESTTPATPTLSEVLTAEKSKQDVHRCRSSREGASPQCTLAGYKDLSPWSAHLKPPVHRITIASPTKPFINSHYKKPKIPASESSVCVKNGLQFKLFDLTRQAWATEPFSEVDFTHFGSLYLPEGSSYKHLRYALEGTSHTSNQVLADQSDCPQDISLHEHYAFGTLRSGPRLQWINIARGLEENHLSFSRVEVDLLHTQAAWQLGPLLPDNQSREWHLELADPGYGRLLVKQALVFLNRVRGNWLEATSVRTVVMLVTRLLATTTDDGTQQDAYKFLREARRVTFKWLQELLAKLQSAEIPSQVTDYQRRICEMAAICRSTYDVDMPHIPKVFVTTKDYHVAIFCSVTLYDNQPLELSNLPWSLQAQICRDRRFAYKIAPIITKVLTRMPQLLDGAILQLWSSYQPGSLGWTSHLEPGSRWVSTVSESSPGRSSQQVFLNLLEGRLLVDGKPLGRLPKEYVAHPTYIRIFGEKVLDVAPSSSPGMEFTARSLIEKHEVSFHLDGDTGELIIRTRTEDATLELMSPTCVLENFPLFFSSDYHHWITIETGAVEFRPLSTPWTSRSENWWLRPTGESTYTMERPLDNQTVFLMDSQSLMFQSIISQICPLEDPRYIHATVLLSASQRLLVQLPRMKLEFFMNDKQQLESNNFRGLVIDKSQFIGTMLGLHNRLVLRVKDPIVRNLPRSRCVLIPYGNVKFAAHDGHVHITIDPGSSRHITCHQYKVDTDLGYLAGSVTLTSRLFKIYLHALTSYCLPDRLTGRTGTEEALHELSESITLSFSDIDREQAHLLQLIGDLTPKRKYYPVHLRSMMTTHWHDLSPLSQHFAFCTTASSILSRAESLRLFNSSSFDMKSYTTKLDSILLSRAAHRTHVCYPLDATTRLPTVKDTMENRDQEYTGRSFLANGLSEQGQIALWTSKLIHGKWKIPIYTPCNLVSLVESWDAVHGASQKLALTYNSDWLSLNLPHSWITVYNLCRQSSAQGTDRYKLCYCLASAAYSGQLPQTLVPVVLAFATNTRFLNIAPPAHPSYHLSDKYRPTSDRIQVILSAKTLGFNNTPAHHLARFPNETTENWTQRQRDYYTTNISRLTTELTQTWATSWPGSPFAPPSTTYSLWLNIDSCLEQIDGNFGVRSIQTQVASEMISPSSGSNTILQLNMGEGKSSVIVPITAASLADGSQLVRVVVLKPLWRQMFHLLVSRLGGLVNRRVYYLPFSRSIRMDHERVRQIQNLYTECMREGGVLLVQPEHVLSFKLMGIDRLISSASPQESGIANELHDMQQWLSTNTRDILDESDEILHVRYQLVYTVGEQLPLEGHPDRWTTTQQVLPLVAKHIFRLKRKHFDKLKYEVNPGGQFPLLRIMPDSDEVIAELIQSVANDAMAGQVPNLNFGLLSPKTRENILDLLTKKDLPEDAFTLLEDFEPPVRNGLLLLRGLLACGILVFALRDKHYRVDYGLHSSRSLLAVPYHAKDIPSLRAEFGHPDVAIVLTCLSYYYHGLTDDQLGICFELLYKLDNPALEYEQWVHENKAIPLQLRQLNGVNMKDREQFTVKLFPAFSCNSAVINFFLSSVVFPKSAKQFPHKLSTSGWDLAEAKGHVTTGFSGTNDNRYLLPVSISQSDPVKQSSTNALVLTYLLRPENNHYLCARGAGGKVCSAKEFLGTLVKQNPEIRVLLDVGAQMLDLRNDELVKHWLELRPDVSAAVYFNDMDELVILPQNGSPASFFSSPFAQQLDKCIVYLDDGHTRGTDLDLPRQTRAAVTLGPKVTKDRLLQGCMRMRKLGHGQSVVFCAPAEIDLQIRKAARLSPQSRIDALDVLRWAMLETCKDLEHHVSHWAQQGIEYSRRTGQQNSTSTKSNMALKDNWMTPEYRSLQDMYGISSSTVYSSRVFTSKTFGVPGLKERLQDLGACGLDDPSMGEEQEREVSQEIERERQVERPLKSYPATHTIHQDIRHFVRTGNVPPRFKGLLSLFCPISLSGFPKPGTWSPKLLASVDFFTVLESHETGRPTPNEYMRPIHWILSGSNGPSVVLSPYEANELIPQIRTSQHVRLHTYSPRTSRPMISFSNLRFYTLPTQFNLDSEFLGPTTQLQLDLFAGQLYLDDYSQYLALCSFLGVYSGANIHSGDNDINVQSDGFIAPGDRERLGDHEVGYLNCGFQSSPIGALKDLVGHRRKGMDYLRTHVGQILHARQLTPSNF
ncbi:hypothetical protein FRC07_008195 [Ceratobasidium sp. 392]|nr:hypothetical protein FRC07_008195 [Ceratobasidium sp. 392]